MIVMKKYFKYVFLIIFFICFYFIFNKIYPYLYCAYTQKPHTPLSIVKYLILDKPIYIQAKYLCKWEKYDIYLLKNINDIIGVGFDIEKHKNKPLDKPIYFDYILYQKNNKIKYMRANYVGDLENYNIFNLLDEKEMQPMKVGVPYDIPEYIKYALYNPNNKNIIYIEIKQNILFPPSNIDPFSEYGISDFTKNKNCNKFKIDIDENHKMNLRCMGKN